MITIEQLLADLESDKIKIVSRYFFKKESIIYQIKDALKFRCRISISKSGFLLREDMIQAKLKNGSKLDIDSEEYFDMFYRFDFYNWCLGGEYEGQLIDDTLIITHKYEKYHEKEIQEELLNFSKENLDITLKIPSKKLLVTNFLEYPEHEDRYSEKYSINHIRGMRNNRKWLAEEYGVLYAQTGNMALNFYQNKEKIIYCDFNTEYYNEEPLYTREEYKWRDDESYLEYVNNWKEEEKFYNYLKDNNYKKIGYISCSMWRVEMIDANEIKKSTSKVKRHNNSSDSFTIKLKTENINHKVYVHELNEHPNYKLIWGEIEYK